MLRQRRRKTGDGRRGEPKEVLTPRQKRAVEAFVGSAGGVKKKALLAAGYPATVAAHQAHREWTPAMDSYGKQLLDREGITDAMLVAQHKKLLSAKKPIVVDGKVKSYITDNETQSRMVRLGYEVKGILKSSPDVVNTINILVEAIGPIILKFVEPERQAAAFEEFQQRISAPSGS